MRNQDKVYLWIIIFVTCLVIIILSLLRCNKETNEIISDEAIVTDTTFLHPY